MSGERPLRPPRWAERLLHAVLPPGLVRDSVLGDLEEELRERAVRGSPGAARRWYARQALGVALRYAVRRSSPTRTPAAAAADHHGGGTVLRPLGQAIVHAHRSLSHAPGFVLAAALTLALGVGGTTAIFSVVDAILLRPLPFPDPDGLVRLFYAAGGDEHENHSEPEFHDIAREVGALSSVAAYREGSPVLGSAAEPERVRVAYGSADLLPLLGVEPSLGRVYTAAEDVPDAERVIVLSHGLWTRAFGADPGVVGASLRLEDVPHTVVGVMPEGFAYPRPEVEAWAPLRLDLVEPWARNNHYLQVVARLAPGATVASAAAELDALGARLTEAYPGFYAERVGFRPRPLRDVVVGDVRTPLLLLMGAVVGVLLIASVNAAGLFLVRGERRRGEIAVRTALGAGRARVAAQLLVESAVVSLVAAALGIGLAWAGVAALKAAAPPELPRLEAVALDPRVLVFGLAVALATGLVFGLVPAVQAWRSEVRDVLSSGVGGLGSPRGARFRRGLVVVQLALATVLTLGAGLLLRSFAELRQVDLGFRPEGVLVVPLSPSAAAVPVDTAAVAWYRALEERVAALPGVHAVGSAYRIPLAGGHDNFSVQLEDRPVTTVGDAPAPGMQWATPGYFEAMGIALRRGRLFTGADHAEAPSVAVVNERAAREMWPGEEALGKRLRMFTSDVPWMEVVGVVADVKHHGVQAEPSPKLYIPHLQGYRSGYFSPAAMALFVRTDGDPTALADPVRAVVRELGPTVPIGAVRTMEDIAAAALARERFTMLLLGVFAAVALVLAAVGVYGVFAQAVASRTREIGLRMAMGAAGGTVAGQVLREGLTMAVWGLGLGMVAGLATARALSAVLYDVSPSDPWTYAAAVPLLAAVVALASLKPALRAARLDPVRALREG